MAERIRLLGQSRHSQSWLGYWGQQLAVCKCHFSSDRLFEEQRALYQRLEPWRWDASRPAGVAGLLGVESNELWLEWVEGPAWDEADPAIRRSSLEPLLCLLDKLHSQSLWHGDLKPAHIRLVAGSRPVLLDFGACWSEPHRSLFTPEWAAPEQLQGRGGPASDLYSLGKMGRALLPELESLWDSCCIDRPQDRPSALQALDILADLVAPEQARAFAPQNLGPSIPLVGRERAWSQLQLALASAAQGAGGFVALRGSSGMGKSRLLREFAASLAGSNQDGGPLGQIQVLWGGFYLGNASLSYGALREAFSQIEAPTNIGASDLRLRQPDQLLDSFPELDRLGVRRSRLGATKPDPEALQTDLATVIEQSSGTSGPYLMILDDVHWADSASLTLLEKLSRYSLGHTLVVLSFRAEEQALQDSGWNWLASVELEPLSSQAVQQLRPLLPSGDTQEGEEILHQAWQWSQGNPFFLLEYLRSPAGSASQHAYLHLRDKLDTLTPTCRQLLAAGALVGRSFRVSQLAGLFPHLAISDIEDSLSEAALRWIVYRDGERFDFVHDRLREAALSAGDTATQRGWHRALAEQSDRPAQQAYHYFQAGESSVAHPLCLAVARAAHQRSSFPKAREYYEMALHCQDRMETRLWHLEVLGHLQQQDQFFSQAEECLQRAQLLPQRLEVYSLAVLRCTEWGLVERCDEYWTRRNRELGRPSHGFWHTLFWLVSLNQERLGQVYRDWRLTQNYRTASGHRPSFLMGVYLALVSKHDGSEAVLGKTWLCCILEHFGWSWFSQNAERFIDFNSVQDPGDRLICSGMLSLAEWRQTRLGPVNERFLAGCEIHLRMQGYDRALLCMVSNFIRLMKGDLLGVVSHSQSYLEECRRHKTVFGAVMCLHGLALARVPLEPYLQDPWTFSCLGTWASDQLVRLRQLETLWLEAVRSGQFEDCLELTMEFTPIIPRDRCMYWVRRAQICRVAAESLARCSTGRLSLLREAQRRLQQALPIAPAMRLYSIEAKREMGLVQIALGQPEPGRKWLQKSLDEAVECAQSFEECLTRSAWSQVAQSLGWNEARQQRTLALQLAQCLQAPWLIPAEVDQPQLTQLLPQRGRAPVWLENQGLHHDSWPELTQALERLAQAGISSSSPLAIGTLEVTGSLERFSRSRPVQAGENSSLFWSCEIDSLQRRLEWVRRQCGSGPLQQELESLDQSSDLAKLQSEFEAKGMKISWPPRLTQAQIGSLSFGPLIVQVLREGLTNAFKHAKGQPVYVGWDTRFDLAKLTISNPVREAAQTSAGLAGGFGLATLGWRARQNQVRFEVVAGPKLWQLQLSLSCPEQMPNPAKI